MHWRLVGTTLALSTVALLLAACGGSGGFGVHEPNLDGLDRVPDDEVAGHQLTIGGLRGPVLVFILDGGAYYAAGLHIANPDNCDYVHVHGDRIVALVHDLTAAVESDRDFERPTRTEHLSDCGFGPPNFYVIDDPTYEREF